MSTFALGSLRASHRHAAHAVFPLLWGALIAIGAPSLGADDPTLMSVLQGQLASALAGATRSADADTLGLLKAAYPDDFADVASMADLQLTYWSELRDSDRVAVVTDLMTQDICEPVDEASEFFMNGLLGSTDKATATWLRAMKGLAGRCSLWELANRPEDECVAVRATQLMSDATRAFMHFEYAKACVIDDLSARAEAHDASAPDNVAIAYSDAEAANALFVRLFRGVAGQLLPSAPMGIDRAELERAAASMNRARAIWEREAGTCTGRGRVQLDAIAPAFGRRLGDGDLYISYCSGAARTVVFSAWRERGTLVVARDTLRTMEAVLRKEIVRLRDQILLGREDISYHSRIVSRLLIPPRVAGRIAAARRVIISPHGAVWTAPFAALTVDGHYLGAAKRLSYAYTLAVVRDRHSEAGDVLIVGNPGQPRARDDVNGSLYGRPQAPLPGAHEEAEDLAALYGVDAIEGVNANETAVRSKMVDAELVHFACHGSSLDSPGLAMSSALMLAHSSVDSTTLGDGFLKAWEIMFAGPMRASLVVLSACESGLISDHDDEGGERSAALLGLPLGFAIAGADAVVATQWLVNDAYGRSFMHTFHEAYRKGSAPDEALRLAIATHSNGVAASDWSGYFVVLAAF